MFRIPITFHSFKISGLLANNQNAIQSMSQQSLLLLQRSQSQLPLNQDDYKIDFFKKNIEEDGISYTWALFYKFDNIDKMIGDVVLSENKYLINAVRTWLQENDTIKLKKLNLYLKLL